MIALQALVLAAALQNPAPAPAKQEPPKVEAPKVEAPKPLQGRDEILKQDIENAVKKLASDRHTESFLAGEELKDLGRRAVPALVAELGKADLKPAMKRRLCEVLGAIRDPHKDALAALAAKLKDPDEWGTSIASAAAAALGAIGDDSSIPALVDTLKSKRTDLDKILKYECIRALGLLRAKEAVELLKKALEDKKSAVVSDDDTQGQLIATAAADALGLIRAADAADDLGKLLADITQDPRSQQSLGVHAARALQRILEHELRGKTEKDEPRAGALAGEPKDVNATLEAWKKWHGSAKAKKDIDKAKGEIAKIVAAVEAYHKEQGSYPLVIGMLKTKPETAKTWPKDGYYQGELRDPWSVDYQIRAPGSGAAFDVFSYGPDRSAWGGGDNADLYNHENWKALKKAESKKVLDETVKALDKFFADQGRYPDILIELVSKPNYPLKTAWPEKGYLQAPPKDGFDNPLIYRVGPRATGGQPYDLVSPGANKAEGADDKDVDEDLWNHDKRPPRKDDKK